MTKKQKHLETKHSICIVVGPMPFSKKILTRYQKESDLDLVFIDGGAKHLQKFARLIKKNGISPQYFGDGDSSNKVMNHKKRDQNLSDLAYFLKNAVLKKNLHKYEHYLFLGFLGGRMDHELINIGEFFRFMKSFNAKTTPRVFIEDKIEFFPKGLMETNVMGTFSVTTLEKSKFKISGQCLYKTKSPITLQGLSSRGLSNTGKGVIKIESTAPLAIFKNN